MIIATLIILASTLVFVVIAFVATYFQIIRPMQEQLAERRTILPLAYDEAISKRADEIELVGKTNHLDVRGDIFHLSRRVAELEEMLSDRPTIEMPFAGEGAS